MRRLAAGLLVALLSACASKELIVRVQPPAARGTRTYVQLRAGEGCGSGIVSAGAREWPGETRLLVRACGEQHLLVGREGFLLSDRAIDTCAVSEVDVTLEPLPTPRTPANDCERAAASFVSDWIAGRAPGGEPIQVEPAIALPRGAKLPPTDGVVAWDTLASRTGSDACTVPVRFYYADSCVAAWSIVLSGGPTPRVESLRLGGDESVSSRK